MGNSEPAPVLAWLADLGLPQRRTFGELASVDEIIDRCGVDGVMMLAKMATAADPTEPMTAARFCAYFHQHAGTSQTAANAKIAELRGAGLREPNLIRGLVRAYTLDHIRATVAMWKHRRGAGAGLLVRMLVQNDAAYDVAKVLRSAKPRAVANVIAARIEAEAAADEMMNARNTLAANKAMAAKMTDEQRAEALAMLTAACPLAAKLAARGRMDVWAQIAFVDEAKAALEAVANGTRRIVPTDEPTE